MGRRAVKILAALLALFCAACAGRTVPARADSGDGHGAGGSGAYDYRSTVSAGLAALGCLPEGYGSMDDMSVYEMLICGEASAMKYYADTCHLMIPNDTVWMELLQELALHSDAYAASGRDYAADLAQACRKRFEDETGREYPIPADKIALEIRIHYDAYALFKRMGYAGERSRLTDIRPGDAGAYQDIIDMLYEMGAR